jgi:hypothetical protein
MLIPILLFVVLLVVVLGAHSMRKKGTMTEATYSTLVSGVSIVVTIAALAILYLRLRS